MNKNPDEAKKMLDFIMDKITVTLPDPTKNKVAGLYPLRTISMRQFYEESKKVQK